ncbi:MAG: HAMP domain-containing sensor histidine kinase [bacterium]|nr:HAMP domain-containing sensor histidine kinase [bacterium]
MNRLFFTDTDIIRIKNDTYLNNVESSSLNLEVRDMNGEIIYSTMESQYPLKVGMEQISDDHITRYVVTVNEEGKHELVVNKRITLSNKEYYLTYINQIEDVYQERNNYFILLFIYNIISSFVAIIVIYFFTDTITRPLYAFIKNINEIINKNYSYKLKKESSIKEIQDLTDSFNIMGKEISSQIDMLEKKSEEKQRFIDSLTHEIRTPLTSIIGYSSLYINNPTMKPENLMPLFEQIYDSGKRIESLTENLIKLITLDKSVLEMTEISVLDCIKKIVHVFNSTVCNERVKITIEGEDFTVIADEYLLTTLFSNFIDNAIKATEEKKDRKLKISLQHGTVIISDNGKGVPSEDLDKIFEPFFMVDKSRKRTMSGFGLGLSICAAIIQILDIQFDITSQLREGTDIILGFNGGSNEKI